MNLYLEQFSEKFNFHDCGAPSKNLIIATTARCGSHMLGHALYESKQFGFPLEYLNPANLRKWKELLGGENTQQVMDKLKKIRTSENGVFSLKLHYPHLDNIGGFCNLCETFPNTYFVLIRRSDVLGQAISYAIALQTGVWINGQEAVNDNPLYSFERIVSCVKTIINENSAWKYLFTISGYRALEVDYDAAKMDISGCIKSIGDYMDVDLDGINLVHSPVTMQQKSELNFKWREKFLSETKNRDYLENLLKKSKWI